MWIKILRITGFGFATPSCGRLGTWPFEQHVRKRLHTNRQSHGKMSYRGYFVVFLVAISLLIGNAKSEFLISDGTSENEKSNFENTFYQYGTEGDDFLTGMLLFMLIKFAMRSLFLLSNLLTHYQGCILLVTSYFRQL